eukprot:1369638-Rhodomonas_salina.1
MLKARKSGQKYDEKDDVASKDEGNDKSLKRGFKTVFGCSFKSLWRREKKKENKGNDGEHVNEGEHQDGQLPTIVRAKTSVSASAPVQHAADPHAALRGARCE